MNVSLHLGPLLINVAFFLQLLRNGSSLTFRNDYDFIRMFDELFIIMAAQVNLNNGGFIIKLAAVISIGISLSGDPNTPPPPL